MERLEQIRKEFITYLKKKYKNNIDDLKSKWGKSNLKDWNNIRFPTKTGKYFKEGNNIQKEAIKDFWGKHKDLKNEAIDEVVGDNG